MLKTCGKHKIDGLYVPSFLKKSIATFVFFAIDDTDFAEDTVDGKSTTHSNVVYKKASASDYKLYQIWKFVKPKTPISSSISCTH